MNNTVVKNKVEPNKKVDIYLKLINDYLLKVQKPGQYLGIEWGHLVQKAINGSTINGTSDPQVKHWDKVKARLAIIYPDLYELGMSNFGTKILYQVINKHSDYLCDRAYAPMSDMEEILKKDGTSLWGWESFKPLNEFDLLGFSLSYELNYTNVLNMLKLSKLAPLSEERKEIFPLVFAGGPATFNPEPTADFMDFFIIGDGEEILIEILDTIKGFKEQIAEGRGLLQQALTTPSKDELLLRLTQIKGIYVPKFYTPDPEENYLPKPIKKEITIKQPGSNIDITFKIPEKIEKRVVSLTEQNQPTTGPVPYLASVQDRQVLEIRRGCDRGCRFCQPGYVYLPVRERTPKQLVQISKEALENTGYDEYSLLSLSASDYTRLHELALTLNNTHSSKGISLSMPSQRADRFDIEIANELNTVRKSGITLAPEAGTERLREVINKGLKEDQIRKAIENVYDSGFNHVKLYFMIGLPTETTEDLEGIISLLKWATDLSKVKKKRTIDITCTISTFVPKSFTPFQWFSQDSTKEFSIKINYLRNRIKELKLRTVKLNCTEPKIALLEAVISRGDRRISKLVYRAFQKGARFDAWDEHFNLDTWREAGKELNIDLDEEVKKHREVGSINPWDVIDSGLLNKFLIDEWNKAVAVTETAACTENTCHACGVCFELDVLNEVTEDKSDKNKFVKVIESKELIEENPVQKPESRTSNSKSYIMKSAQKLEIIHTKTGDLRFISHLDLQKLFERALRRAKIPIAFTEGFNPRPKMQWVMPLPLYYESNHELMHLDIGEVLDENDIKTRINKQLPEELQITSLKNMSLPSKLPNPENIIIIYKVLTYDPNLWEKYRCELKSASSSFLKKDSHYIKIQKKNQNSEKLLDLRPSVENIEIKDLPTLELELTIKGNLRAELILDGLLGIAKEQIQSKEIPDISNGWQNIWKVKKEQVLGIRN
jgi:radical SAM family uncharacterized protein/radical SAM-linked protein